MVVECKFDKNYNVTSDWSLENMTERDFRLSRSSLPSLHLIPDPQAHHGLPSAAHCSLCCWSLLVLLPTQPSPYCLHSETYISVDRI